MVVEKPKPPKKPIPTKPKHPMPMPYHPMPYDPHLIYEMYRHMKMCHRYEKMMMKWYMRHCHKGMHDPHHHPHRPYHCHPHHSHNPHNPHDDYGMNFESSSPFESPYRYMRSSDLPQDENI